MKKILPLMALLAGSILLLSNLDGAFPENTGAPGELTCGRAPCHNVPVNVGTAQMSIAFSGNDLKYVADSTYELTVTIANQQSLRNGFEILALNENNQNTGEWILLDPDKMKIIPGIGLPSRKYVTHQAAGNMQTEWKIAWKAPSADVGVVTFYASVNATNNNGMLTGDEVYTRSLAVDFSPLSGTQETARPEVSGIVSVSPDGTNGTLLVRYFLKTSADVRFEIFNISGQKMSAIVAGKQPQGEHQVSWSNLSASGSGTPPGVYFIRLAAGRETAVRKFVWP